MAPNKHQNLQVPSKFKRPNSLNWTLHILLTISIFAFLILLYSSCLLTSFKSLLFYSTYIYDHFKMSFNREFMFILCSGILVFVTQGSGLNDRPPSLPSADDHDEFHMMKNRDDPHPQSTHDIVELKVCAEDEEGMVESVRAFVHVVEKEEEEEEEEEEGGYEGDDDYDQNGSLVVGESDQRFEDFIKEMKEKMRIEAVQLVLVV